MIRFMWGMFTASLILIAAYTHGPGLLEKLFNRGDQSEWGDVCKSPEYRYFNGGKP